MKQWLTAGVALALIAGGGSAAAQAPQGPQPQGQDHHQGGQGQGGHGGQNRGGQGGHQGQGGQVGQPGAPTPRVGQPRWSGAPGQQHWNGQGSQSGSQQGAWRGRQTQPQQHGPGGPGSPQQGQWRGQQVQPQQHWTGGQGFQNPPQQGQWRGRQVQPQQHWTGGQGVQGGQHGPFGQHAFAPGRQIGAPARNYGLRDRDRGRGWFSAGGFQRQFHAERRYHVGPYFRPNGWYFRTWAFGDFLPWGWYAPQYYLDWAAYGLPPPPVGCEWIREGNDAVLVDIWTGEVLSVDYGVFY
jgi:Ni/Co efflux regulator RcnB